MIEDLNDKSDSNEDFFLNGEYFFDGSPSSNEPPSTPSNVYKSTNQDDINEHKNINQANNSKTFIGNKRRPPKNHKHEKKEKPRKTRKYEKDEIFLKLQGHFITFIIKFVNLVLKILNNFRLIYF